MPAATAAFTACEVAYGINAAVIASEIAVVVCAAVLYGNNACAIALLTSAIVIPVPPPLSVGGIAAIAAVISAVISVDSEYGINACAIAFCTCDSETPPPSPPPPACKSFIAVWTLPPPSKEINPASATGETPSIGRNVQGTLVNCLSGICNILTPSAR